MPHFARLISSRREVKNIFSDIPRVLGKIYRSKRMKEKSIHHFETTLRIASPFNWYNVLFWIHHAMAELFHNGAEFDGANAYTQRAKSHAIEGTLAHSAWYQQRRLGEAKLEVSHLRSAGRLGLYMLQGLVEDLLKRCNGQ